MGILVMRLNEYRMTEHTGMNVPLKHVTVLEEAHNILKAYFNEQNPKVPIWPESLLKCCPNML